MVWQFIDVFKRVAGRGIEDDDFADRLTHRYTVAILIIFCILVGSSQFVGSPIACWVPAHFSGSMTTYTNNICWISNTYYVPTEGFLPKPNEERLFRINYYQWVPFILTLMAFLCYTPFAIWRVMSKHNDIQAKSIMKIISSIDQGNSEAREKSIRTVCKIIDRSIEINRDWNDVSVFGRIRRGVGRCFLSKSNGSYITALYFIIKLLNIASVFGQFFLLNCFMGSRYHLFGFNVIQDLKDGKDFWESERFPRITMCDFTIRTLGENNQKNTIQCTLPINLFNEKVFIFIWFWYFLVTALSCYSIVIWIINMCPRSRQQFVRRYLRNSDRLPYNHTSSGNITDSKMFESFIINYLRLDGLFLLRIVKKNSNDLIVGELISALWEQYKRHPKINHSNDDSIHKDNEKLLMNDGGESLLPNGYHHNP